MREEERRDTEETLRRETVPDIPGLGDPLGAKEAKLPPPSLDLPQVETAKKTVPPDRPASTPMDVPTTASSTSESLTTTVDLNLMKEKVPDTEGKVPDTEGKASKEELPQFILAPAFMDIVCPECGALLQGASPTNLKNRQLQHPFGDPPLGGVPCRFKGKMFKTPVVRIDLLY